MDAETEEQDPFLSITKLCQPTASQEAKFLNCPFALESENFANLNSEQFPSSPEPTPSEPTAIVMVTPPGSISSAHQQAEDDAVFHTPPEQHLPAYFSSEDQNLEELYPPDAGASSGRSKKARVSEVGSDDEFNSERSRVPGEEFGGKTVSAVNTELVVVDEVEVNEGVHDATEVVGLDSAGSGEEMATLDLVVRKACEFSRDCAPEASAVYGNCGSGKDCESVDDVHVSKGRSFHNDSSLSGRLDSVESKTITIKLKCNGVTTIIQEGGVGGSDNFSKEQHKGIEENDELGDVGGVGSRKRWRDKTDGASVNNGFGGRRQLPVSLEGKEKDARGENAVELKSRLLDHLDALKVMVGYMDGGCEEVDFLGTAKRRGVTFPRPRWWSAEDEDE